MKSFYSNGKLLISGEYLVLDGALSLALPTKFGQNLSIQDINSPQLIWNSLDYKNDIWYQDVFSINNQRFISQSNDDNAISKRLIQILNVAKELNPNFLKNSEGLHISTKLSFPNNWGLGSSSTLINNIAKWAQVDPFELLKHTFGGSGYDIACAQSNSAITYQLNADKAQVHQIDFNPPFKEKLYFVHLNKKQNSRIGISNYKALTKDISKEILAINAITRAIQICDTLLDFQKLLLQHEIIISNIIEQDTIQNVFFNDFNGQIKSLGAWGGDFVLVASEDNPSSYFESKGYRTIRNFNDMIL